MFLINLYMLASVSNALNLQTGEQKRMSTKLLTLKTNLDSQMDIYEPN